LCRRKRKGYSALEEKKKKKNCSRARERGGTCREEDPPPGRIQKKGEENDFTLASPSKQREQHFLGRRGRKTKTWGGKEEDLLFEGLKGKGKKLGRAERQRGRGKGLGFLRRQVAERRKEGKEREELSSGGGGS